jgi:hypothetical protein
VAVGFIGGGNQNTRRKPPICRKSLTNIISHNVVSSTPCHERGKANYHAITIAPKNIRSKRRQGLDMRKDLIGVVL